MSPARLSQIAAGLTAATRSGDDVQIHDLTARPEEVTSGVLFVALRPAEIPIALARGAVAVVTTQPRPETSPVSLGWLEVEHVEIAAGALAAALHGDPTRDLQVLAVTGTNGKTTVSWMIQHILAAAGRRCGLIGTVEVQTHRRTWRASSTTPPSWCLQAWLAEARDAGCDSVAMEASSHALSSGPLGHRLSGARIRVGGFTNLTPDHLDYHGDMASYLAAKARLFSDGAETACFNIDDAAGVELAGQFAGGRLTVSTRGRRADLVLVSAEYQLTGTTARLDTPSGPATLRLSLVGRHNIENALVAVGMTALAGVPIPAALAALASLTRVPGRLQRVGTHPTVFVDYAHTPDGLDNVLRALRPLVRGKLICVFGAGGDRDRSKRPMMGAVASTHADLIVVTSDNPRSEVPTQIIDEICAGVHGGARAITCVDRRAAIGRAIQAAGPDDLVVIAGKGHEATQEIAGRRLPFDDCEVAHSIMAGAQRALSPVSGSQIQIRKATPEDAPAFLAHIRAIVGEPDRNIPLDPAEVRTEDEQRTLLAELAAASTSVMLLAEHAGELVGELSLRGMPRRAQRHVAVLGMTVRREHRGRGIGARLMAAALAWCERTPVARIELHVFTRNAPAIRLYERFGFVREGQRRRAALIDGMYLDDLVMARVVAPSSPDPEHPAGRG